VTAAKASRAGTFGVDVPSGAKSVHIGDNRTILVQKSTLMHQDSAKAKTRRLVNACENRELAHQQRWHGSCNMRGSADVARSKPPGRRATSFSVF